MTHRGRRLALAFIALVVLGLVLNNIAGRTRSGQGQAGGEATAPAARPLAPLYVPRPASLISGGYGGSLSSGATPQEVARAFAGSYVKYAPDRTSPGSFVDRLPRLAPGARTRVRGQLARDWRDHLSKLSGATATGAVSDPKKGAGQDGSTEVTVDFVKGKGSSNLLHVTLGLEQGDAGWVVTSVSLEEG
ncbi:hypothetical protein [Streptomyces sp. TP-A0356]|uniref:hypothetical protein n=1 Tax=Streptomyces sp. TP-A0356 TaxID=1359208 RepID=UPI0006E17846|nr:hypothetical protein [Streptomyces sp. TP-A0356]